MQQKQNCHIAIILGSFCELYPGNEPRFLDALAPLQGFKAVTVELRKRPWRLNEDDPYPASFGTKEEAESDVNAVIWLKWVLGCDIEGWRETGKSVMILRSFLDGGKKPEILWDSDVGDKKDMDGRDEDVIMGED